MKKFLTLCFGLLIACVAVFAVPKELDKVPIKTLFKIEINHDVTAIVVDQDIQIDVDDGVAVGTYVLIKNTAEELKLKYVVKDEGVPLAGHRRWYNPANQNLIKPTPKGLFDKNRCLESRFMHRSRSTNTGFSGPIPLIE